MGGEKRAIGGRVPKSFVYRPGGGGLRCGIRKTSAGSGTLKVVLEAGNGVRSVQRTDARGGTIRFAFKKGASSSSVVQSDSIS